MVYVARGSAESRKPTIGLALCPAQDGAGLAYPAAHPAQDGMGRRMLRDEIIEHFTLHIFRSDQICRHFIAFIYVEGTKE